MRRVRAIWLAVACLAMVAVVVAVGRWQPVAAAGGGPAAGTSSGYRVLKPIESGDLTLFPVVRDDGRALPADQFLTLDEGLKSGEVEVTEAGKVRGLVRSRGGDFPLRSTGDQVNTLVLVNNSKRPLLLLAGEIVTGGKQDRIIAKDRIVPVGAAPIDLSVFCIEHGRWTESSAKFGSAGKAVSEGFMVQPAVRQQAMVAKDQQQVWDSVHGAIGGLARAAAPAASSTSAGDVTSTVTVTGGRTIETENASISASLGTTSYAKRWRRLRSA